MLAVSPDIRRRGALDQALWTYDDQSFLPHGQAEAAGLDPARQPVLISETTDNQNEAAVALLMDGADMPVDSAYERCMVMFDDGDAPVRNKARQLYKAASDAGLTTRYFQQTEQGGWKEAG